MEATKKPATAVTPGSPEQPGSEAGAFPFPTAKSHPKHAEVKTNEAVVELPTEEAIDHGVEESFPASDPVSVTVSKSVPSKR